MSILFLRYTEPGKEACFPIPESLQGEQHVFAAGQQPRTLTVGLVRNAVKANKRRPYRLRVNKNQYISDLDCRRAAGMVCQEPVKSP